MGAFNLPPGVSLRDIEDRVGGDEPAWQLGHDIEELRRLAAPFKLRQKPLVHGAFGLIKERDIAAALEAGEARVYRSAVAIVKRLSRDSVHDDFAGRPVRIPAGSHLMRAFACESEEDGLGLLQSELARIAADCQGAALWVDAFEEDATASLALGLARFNYVATKIAAGSEVRGLYCSEQVPAGFEDPAEELTLSVLNRHFLSMGDQAAILAELEAYEHRMPWAQHYSSYNKRKSWTSFSLRGYKPQDPSFIIAPREMSKAWKAEHAEDEDLLWGAPQWTPAADHFPAAMQAVTRIPGAKDRVRFMRLAGGGELSRHADITDREAGVADGKVARLHIPLRTNSGVTFHGWDSRGRKLEAKFPERALCYLDQRKPHAVTNADGSARIHLVVDAISSPELRQWMQ